MAIYRCTTCTFEDTVMAGIRAHFESNPQHGKGGAYTDAYRRAEVHVLVRVKGAHQ